MNLWAVYLRGQADALGLPVIDTSEMSNESVADRVEELAEVRARAEGLTDLG